MEGRQLTTFGKAIKKALVDAGMTQTELERSLHMPPKYLSLIMYGDRSGDKYIPAIVTSLKIDPPGDWVA